VAPKFAPTIRVRAAAGANVPDLTRETTSTTTATLECDNQVTNAAARAARIGRRTKLGMIARSDGAFSIGSMVRIIRCSASSIRPSPIAMRPVCTPQKQSDITG
jgi:hypothetical protein